jgi:hypothetical protein
MPKLEWSHAVSLDSGFVIVSSFVIRHSAFLTMMPRRHRARRDHALNFICFREARARGWRHERSRLQKD